MIWTYPVTKGVYCRLHLEFNGWSEPLPHCIIQVRLKGKVKLPPRCFNASWGVYSYIVCLLLQQGIKVSKAHETIHLSLRPVFCCKLWPGLLPRDREHWIQGSCCHGHEHDLDHFLFEGHRCLFLLLDFFFILFLLIPCFDAVLFL